MGRRGAEVGGTEKPPHQAGIAVAQGLDQRPYGHRIGGFPPGVNEVGALEEAPQGLLEAGQGNGEPFPHHQPPLVGGEDGEVKTGFVQVEGPRFPRPGRGQEFLELGKVGGWGWGVGGVSLSTLPRRASKSTGASRDTSTLSFSQKMASWFLRPPPSSR